MRAHADNNQQGRYWLISSVYQICQSISIYWYIVRNVDCVIIARRQAVFPHIQAKLTKPLVVASYIYVYINKLHNLCPCHQKSKFPKKVMTMGP